MTKKAMLIILDGWGIGKNPEVDAIAKADTPFYDSLLTSYPNATLTTFGEDVGLPEGQMGNSEVGHLNIGAGRIVFQALARINNAVKDGSLAKNVTLKEGIDRAKKAGSKFHLIGLLSDGGVHSHIKHLKGLIKILDDNDLDKVYVHSFLDGRDTSPRGGLPYLQDVKKSIEGTKVKLASVIGRYFAMDRDNRWDRIAKAYDLLVNGAGEDGQNLDSLIQEKYDADITDEFMPPILIDKEGLIQKGDTILFYNFRTDRPRQITRALSQTDYPDQNMEAIPLHFMTMTNYDESFENIHVLFEKDNINNTIGQVLEQHGKSQLRIAETEKYPHVTFFFNGGREKPFDEEDRILIPSPKVATYDLQPEMSAVELTDALCKRIGNNPADYICVNYANTDMVGHTGNFEAAKAAAQVVDSCVRSLVYLSLDKEYQIIIIADHGNADIMENEDGTPHTAHTTNLVPIIYVSKDGATKSIKSGTLADIAPTILQLMNINPPQEMTGKNLIS